MARRRTPDARSKPTVPIPWRDCTLPEQLAMEHLIAGFGKITVVGEGCQWKPQEGQVFIYCPECMSWLKDWLKCGWCGWKERS